MRAPAPRARPNPSARNAGFAPRRATAPPRRLAAVVLEGARLFQWDVEELVENAGRGPRAQRSRRWSLRWDERCERGRPVGSRAQLALLPYRILPSG